MTPQEGKRCVLAILAFLNNYYGGTLTPAELDFKYFEKYVNPKNGGIGGFGPFFVGVKTSNVSEFTKMFLNTQTHPNPERITLHDITSTIDNGHMIMTEIDGGLIGHNILIIAYEGSNIVYVDPQTGTQKKMDPTGKLTGGYFEVIVNKK